MKKFYSPISIAIFSVLISFKCLAQADHITMSLANDTVLNSTTIQFDLYVVSDGATGSDLRANCFQYGVNFNKDILAATATFTTSFVVGSSDFIPPLNSFVFPAASAPDHIRIVEPVYGGGNNGLFTMVLGHQYRVGTFRIQSSLNWVAGKTPNLCLQDSVEPGKTKCGAIVYIGNSASVTSVPTTVFGSCSHCNIWTSVVSTNETCPGALDGTASVTPTSGTPPFTFLWNNGATTTSLTSLSAGYYSVIVTDTNGCLGYSVARVFESKPFCNYNTLKGVCFLDYNNNQVKDIGEPGYNKLLVVSKGSVNTYSSTPDAAGGYLNYLIDTGTTVTNVQNVTGPYSYYTITPLQHSSYFSSYFNSDSVDFAITPTPGIQDLRITLHPAGRTRVGMDVVYRMVYSNVGTDTVSGTITLIKDSRLVLVSSSPAYTSVNVDTITWSYTNLLPTESRTIDVTLHVPAPPVVNVGDYLHSIAIIDPIATDTFPKDNYSVLEADEVVGAVDPNDKTMLGGESFTVSQVASGDYFTYLVRFQNTGTDTAFYVAILDTLDGKLDAASFEMISASHSYNLSILNEKYVKWTFNNIMLPDSNHNEPESHGYVCYRIRPKSTVAAGDVITNSAAIVFDFNLPVITNTAFTTIVLVTESGGLQSSSDKLNIFPNPVSDKLVLAGHPMLSGKEAIIEIHNVLGEKVYERKITGTARNVSIDVSSFHKGVYFVSLQDLSKRVVARFVKN